MSDSFIDMLKMQLFVNKIARFTGSNPNNPSLADELLYTIFLFTHRMKKRSLLFKNNYVCVDAELILMVYTDYLLASSPDSDAVTEELMRKCLLALKGLYKIPLPDLRQMWDNRINYFSDIIYEQEDLSDYTTVAQEAALLFTYDLVHNKYIEFKRDTPVLIVGFDKQFMIEQETNSYFKVMIPMISKCVYNEG